MLQSETINTAAETDEKSLQIERLQKENATLRERLANKSAYIRDKINELLLVMGTKPLNQEELDDEMIIELDPLGILSGSISHVLENLKETNQRIHFINQETSAIFAAADVGILVIDDNKRIKACNNKLRQLFFVDKEIDSVIGSFCSDEVCRSQNPEEGCVCDMLCVDRKPVRINSWKFEGRIFNVMATPIMDQNDFISDMVVVYNDITDLKSAEQKLSNLNAVLETRIHERTKQLESVNNELESFSYTVSHDLRAPLRHIIGFTNILIEECSDSINDVGRDCIKRISNASRRMNLLIDDLLHLSKVSQTEMNIMKIDLSESAAKNFQMYRDTDPDRNISIEIEKGLTTFGDPMLIDLVLQNLIGNAWKYSSRNPAAEIRIGRVNVNGKDAFYVRDNGAGFDMAYSNKLFRVFERLHGSEFEGTGIGLATVKRIINRHGGDVWADSDIGKGSTFYFTLPDNNLILSS